MFAGKHTGHVHPWKSNAITVNNRTNPCRPGLHSIGKKINLRWAHNRRNTDEESTRTHNRNSAVKKTACTADKKWELPLKAPTPLHRFWSFFVPNQPSFPYPPPTPPPEGIDQTIWFHPHNWPFSLYLACRCDPSSDMQKPEEEKTWRKKEK